MFDCLDLREYIYIYVARLGTLWDDALAESVVKTDPIDRARHGLPA